MSLPRQGIGEQSHPRYLSQCCSADVRSECGEPDFPGMEPAEFAVSTCWFVCAACGEACDVKERPATDRFPYRLREPEWTIMHMTDRYRWDVLRWVRDLSGRGQTGVHHEGTTRFGLVARWKVRWHLRGAGIPWKEIR